MNYISEINLFYDWLETNNIPKSAVAMWYALMHVNNKSKWQESFEVAISTLEFKTKFKRSELYKARQILTEKGRISWTPRGGNLSAIYQIFPLCVHNTDANGNTTKTVNVPSVHNTDANGVSVSIIRTQMVTTNKLNNKLNNTRRRREDNGSELPTHPHDEIVEFKKFENWIMEHAGNVSKLKEPFTIGQYFKLKKKYSKQQITELLLKMGNYKPLQTKNISAYKTFLNWSQKNYEKWGDGKSEISNGLTPLEIKTKKILAGEI